MIYTNKVGRTATQIACGWAGAVMVVKYTNVAEGQKQ